MQRQGSFFSVIIILFMITEVDTKNNFLNFTAIKSCTTKILVQPVYP